MSQDEVKPTRLLQALVVIAAVVAPNVAAAQDEQPPNAVDAVAAETNEEAPDVRANRLAQQGVRAARGNDPESAVDLLRRAASLAPDDSLYRYSLGVALEQLGDVDEARTAYDEALAGASADGPAGRAALFNRANLELREALTTAERVSDPAQLAQAIAMQGGGSTPSAEVENAMRRQLLQKGIQAARDAIPRYRDLVRRDPSDAPVARNLEIAQRTRRTLEQALEDLEPPPRDDKGEESENEDDPSQEGGDASDDSTSGADGTEDDETGDQGSEGEDQPSDGEQPENDPNDSSSPQDSEGDDGDSTSVGGEQKTDVGDAQEVSSREQANDRLEELMKAARNQLERVRELRRERMRKSGVDRDW